MDSLVNVKWHVYQCNLAKEAMFSYNEIKRYIQDIQGHTYSILKWL